MRGGVRMLLRVHGQTTSLGLFGGVGLRDWSQDGSLTLTPGRMKTAATEYLQADYRSVPAAADNSRVRSTRSP